MRASSGEGRAWPDDRYPINDTSALDFMGALREHGRLTGPSPALWAAAAAAGVAAALTRASWRETRC